MRRAALTLGIVGVLLGLWWWLQHSQGVPDDDAPATDPDPASSEPPILVSGAPVRSENANETSGNVDEARSSSSGTPPTTIIGRVVDEEATPIAIQEWVRIRAVRGVRHRWTAAVSTDAEGWFRFDALDPEGVYRIKLDHYALRKGGEETERPEPVEARPGDPPLEIVVTRKIFAHVEVITWRPPAAEGVTVRARREAPTPHECEAGTDKFGRARLGPLRPGRYRLELASPGGLSGVWIPEIDIEVPGAERASIPLMPSGSVAFRMGGSARVSWRPKGMAIDERSLGAQESHGWWAIGARPDDPPVSGVLFVQRGWRYGLIEDLQPQTTPLVLELKYGRWFEGRVEFETPLEEGDRRVGNVVARSVEYGFTAEYPIARDGSFDAVGLPPGIYRLSYARYVKPSGPEVVIDAGSPTDGVVLREK